MPIDSRTNRSARRLRQSLQDSLPVGPADLMDHGSQAQGLHPVEHRRVAFGPLLSTVLPISSKYVAIADSEDAVSVLPPDLTCRTGASFTVVQLHLDTMARSCIPKTADKELFLLICPRIFEKDKRQTFKQTWSH